jgi:hypothetical protein
MNMNDAPHTEDKGLTIAGKTYRSRLLVGSKYKDLDETRAATVASGAEIITVAIRRVNIGQDPNAPSLLDAVPPSGHHPAQHGRLLQRRRCGLHPATGARTAGRPQAGQAGSAGR